MMFVPPGGVSIIGTGVPTPWKAGVPSARKMRVVPACSPISTVSGRSRSVSVIR